MVSRETQIQPSPSQSQYDRLIADITSGVIRIPKFQRSFVWSRRKSAQLIDSILKGYPVGTLIFWRTQKKIPSVKNIGDIDLSDGNDGGFVQYVLDGQQRLSSLFAITEGKTIKKDGKDVDYKNIFVDLSMSVDAANIVSVKKPHGASITVYDLLHKNFNDMYKEYSTYADKIIEFQNSIRSYLFSTITLDRYPIEKATDIFERINTTGKTLKLFDIMVAMTYDERSFDLRDKHTELQKELSKIQYRIPEPQILQCISANLENECQRRTILELTKDSIQKEWEPTASAIRKAIDHFRTSYKIPSGRLLPYSTLIVPFSYFFSKNKKEPTVYQIRC